jgi:ATP-dependent Lon protease
VFLLDEIDKMSSDWRGDPASALLEVLDPEQNFTFMDHYLEVAYDLSDVMFITTANSVHNIPYPLRDRMEVIEISGYTEMEKEKIAEKFLVEKQIQENGLGWANITFQKAALLSIIRGYTLEAGVRNLEREIANVLRKIARDAIREGRMPPLENADAIVLPAGATEVTPAPTVPQPVESAPADTAADPAEQVPPAVPEAAAVSPAAPAPEPWKVTVTARGVEKYLGKEKFLENTFARDMKPGLAYGLAWTELGGQLLAVEVAIIAGKGELMLTGSLGDVMKESARAALTFLRANHAVLGISADFMKDRDVHIHVPEGAIPKDGPSAGITLTAALLSAVTGAPVSQGFAMTGEITLTGRLLPIGGVKEKVLAAHRYKMSSVLLPRRNEKDLEEIPAEVREEISFAFADSVLDALSVLFPERSFAAAPAGAPKNEPAKAQPAARERSLPVEQSQINLPTL